MVLGSSALFQSAAVVLDFSNGTALMLARRTSASLVLHSIGVGVVLPKEIAVKNVSFFLICVLTLPCVQEGPGLSLEVEQC